MTGAFALVLHAPLPLVVDHGRWPHGGDWLREAAFVFRDPRTRAQVWRRDQGCPGDVAYLELHKKHRPGGLRFWRITDASGRTDFCFADLAPAGAGAPTGAAP